MESLGAFLVNAEGQPCHCRETSVRAPLSGPGTEEATLGDSYLPIHLLSIRQGLPGPHRLEKSEGWPTTQRVGDTLVTATCSPRTHHQAGVMPCPLQETNTAHLPCDQRHARLPSPALQHKRSTRRSSGECRQLWGLLA